MDDVLSIHTAQQPHQAAAITSRPLKFKQWHIAQGCPLTNHRSLLLHTQRRRGNQSAAQEGASALRRALCIHINAPPLAVF